MQRARKTDIAAVANRRKREGGVALLLTSVILVLVSALAFTAIRNSEQESTAAARSRTTTRTFHAADAGIQLAMSRLSQDPVDLSAFDVTLASGATVQSRSREEAGPSTLDQVGLGDTVEGEQLNADAGAGTISRVYLVTVTATSPNGSVTELEAKVSRTSAEATGY